MTVKGQKEVAESNAKARVARYPDPPKYDALAHVRGNPDLRGVKFVNQKDPNPLPILTMMHLLAAFNIDQTSKKRPKHKPNPPQPGSPVMKKIIVGTPRKLPKR